MFGKIADVLFDFGENLFESAENADVKTKVSLYNLFRFVFLLFGMLIGFISMLAGAILGTFNLWFYQRFKMTTGDKYWFKKRG